MSTTTRPRPRSRTTARPARPKTTPRSTAATRTGKRTGNVPAFSDANRLAEAWKLWKATDRKATRILADKGTERSTRSRNAMKAKADGFDALFDILGRG